MPDKSLLGIELALQLLVRPMQLLVLNLDLIVELLDPHEMLHIVLELQVLHLLQAIFHEGELDFQLFVSRF